MARTLTSAEGRSMRAERDSEDRHQMTFAAIVARCAKATVRRHTADPDLTPQERRVAGLAKRLSRRRC
jgi:hypothetical protein